MRSIAHSSLKAILLLATIALSLSACSDQAKEICGTCTGTAAYFVDDVRVRTVGGINSELLCGDAFAEVTKLDTVTQIYPDTVNSGAFKKDTTVVLSYSRCSGN